MGAKAQRFIHSLPGWCYHLPKSSILSEIVNIYSNPFWEVLWKCWFRLISVAHPGSPLVLFRTNLLNIFFFLKVLKFYSDSVSTCNNRNLKDTLLGEIWNIAFQNCYNQYDMVVPLGKLYFHVEKKMQLWVITHPSCRSMIFTWGRNSPSGQSPTYQKSNIRFCQIFKNNAWNLRNLAAEGGGGPVPPAPPCSRLNNNLWGTPCQTSGDRHDQHEG